jgi:hypothetical protein
VKSKRFQVPGFLTVTQFCQDLVDVNLDHGIVLEVGEDVVLIMSEFIEP